MLLSFAFVCGVLTTLIVQNGRERLSFPSFGAKAEKTVTITHDAPTTARRAIDGTGRHAATVLRVIDGDTFEAQVHLWPGMEVVTRVRLRGIDAPELNARCAREFEMATAATEALKKLLASGRTETFNVGPDKYFGRVVADASTPAAQNISAALKEMGLVRVYYGGHRDGWCS